MEVTGDSKRVGVTLIAASPPPRQPPQRERCRLGEKGIAFVCHGASKGKRCQIAHREPAIVTVSVGLARQVILVNSLTEKITLQTLYMYR